MASTYSTNTKLELVTTGEKAGQWGGITNTNLQILEQAATGYLAIDMAGASVTLDLTDGATSNGKNIYLKLTGTDWLSTAVIVSTVKDNLPLVPAAFLFTDWVIVPFTKVPSLISILPSISVTSWCTTRLIT